jgi:hypothetical protein
MEFYEHKLNLEPKDFRKLIKSKAHTVKYEKIGSGLTVHLSGANHKLIMQGYNKKKNKVLKLTKEEIDHNLSNNMVEGSGFFKTLNKIGISRKQFIRGTKSVANVAKPIIKELIPTISAPLGLALSTAIGNPELAPIATIAINKGLNIGADKLGEYGGSGLPHPVSKYYPSDIQIAGSGLENDIKKIVNKGVNFIKNGGSVHKVDYDNGFKHSNFVGRPVISGNGMMQSDEVDHNSLYKNGYMNNKIPLNHPIYNPVKVGGSFKPSGY